MSHAGRYRLYAVLILLVGGAAAGWVYAHTAAAAEDGTAYAVEGGTAYVVRLDDTKAYNRQLERMSGKTGVMAAEFTEWFAGLWHGRSLAYTLATLSLVGALGCLFLSHFQILLPAGEAPPRPGGGPGAQE